MTQAQEVTTPALDQAVVVAKRQFETWLKDNLDRDLNGRQRDLVARVALEIMYPLLKIAYANDIADAMDESEIGPEFKAAFRGIAQDIRAETEEAMRHARQR